MFLVGVGAIIPIFDLVALDELTAGRIKLTGTVAKIIALVGFQGAFGRLERKFGVDGRGHLEAKLGLITPQVFVGDVVKGLLLGQVFRHIIAQTLYIRVHA